MKTIKSTALILALICLTSNLVAQKIFREGYIIKKSGEILTGLVQYSSKSGIPQTCIFKRFDIAREVSYKPSEIIAFGYRNGNRYESAEVDKKVTFLEVLVTGKMVLYQKDSKYYVNKDHEGLTELKNGSINYVSGNETKEFRNTKEFLAYITEGKTGYISDKFRLKDDIVPLVTDYNKISGQKYYVFDRTFTEKQLTQSVFESGASKNKFGVIGGVNLYALNIKFNPDMAGVTLNDYVPASVNGTSPVFGITYERLLSRRTDRLSARVDILYNNQSFYSYSERENYAGGITRDDARFSFKGLKVPVYFQYSLTGGRIVPYANIGAAYQFFISKEYNHTAEVENSMHEITTVQDQNLLLRSGEFTGAAGLGARVRLMNKINLNLMYLFEYGQGMFQNVNITYTSERKKDPYVQNSIQSTIMLGITF